MLNRGHMQMLVSAAVKGHEPARKALEGLGEIAMADAKGEARAFTTGVIKTLETTTCKINGVIQREVRGSFIEANGMVMFPYIPTLDKLCEDYQIILIPKQKGGE